MNAKIWIPLVAVAAAAGGWFAARHFSLPPPSAAAQPAAERRVLYYQSAMHPWIKSDKPGRCTICGMELSPVFEGEAGLPTGDGVTRLGSNIIQVIDVQSEEVRRRPLQRSLRVAGTIEDNDARHRFVSAYVDGRIDQLAVNFVGAEVVAGQPLARLYSPTLLAAEREYTALLRRQTAVPELAADQRRLIEAAAQRLRRFGLTDAQIAALERKGEDEIHTELVAPASGTVVQRFVYEGQYVKEGDKLFELADFSTMWFLFDAYESDMAWLRLGQAVDVTTPSVPGRTFRGTVAFVDPNLREMTRSAKIRVELPNPIIATNGPPRRELLHKVYAEASVHLEIPDVLAVPRTAVLAPGPQAVVYVELGGGAYERRRVKLGRRGDDFWELLEGVNAGEKVVTSGNMLIDAQAQLDAGAQGTAMPSDGPGATNRIDTPHTTSLAPLTQAQLSAAEALVKLVNEVTAALAADNLKDFNQRAARVPEAVHALAHSFPNDSPWRPYVDGLTAAGQVASATDLKTARKHFHPLSEAVVKLAKALRHHEGAFRGVKIFRCPMTKDAFPGAPRTAEWLQLQPEVRNPYFGAEMLDCGSEVLPR